MLFGHLWFSMQRRDEWEMQDGYWSRSGWLLIEPQVLPLNYAFPFGSGTSRMGGLPAWC